MAVSKDYSQREMIIDNCLKGGKRYTGAELMALVNSRLRQRGMQEITSRTTFAADINEMNAKRYYEHNRDIILRERVGRHIFYRYFSDDYSIFNREFTEEEVTMLRTMTDAIRHFRGMPRMEWLDEFEARCQESFGPKGKPVVGFDDNYGHRGMAFFTPLMDAIMERQTVTISYKSFRDSQSAQHTIFPYYLKQYNLRWYLMASYAEKRHPGPRRIYVFSLDRIMAVTQEPDIKYIGTRVSFAHYFDDVVGVTVPRDREVEHIEIWVARWQLPWLKTKPLHRTQKIVSQDSEGAIISIDVKRNLELSQAIMAYGEAMVVLSPHDFREEMEQNIAAMEKIYQNVRFR